MVEQAKSKARKEPLRDSEGLPVASIHKEEPEDKTTRLEVEIDVPEVEDQREAEENQRAWNKFINR